MRPWIILALVYAALAACAPSPASPQIKVEEAWARPAPLAGGNGAVYFWLVNNGTEADRLVGADCPLARAAEVHETMQMEGGVMSMQATSGVEIPAGGQVEFAPGGLHLMLVELQQPLTAGDKVPLVLRFGKTGEMNLDVDVREP